MGNVNAWLQQDNDSVTLICHLQPGAKRSEFVGVHGEALKVRIKAPPVDGKANAELIRFLAKVFVVSQRQVSIISGELNRHKRIKIDYPAAQSQSLPAAIQAIFDAEQ